MNKKVVKNVIKVILVFLLFNYSWIFQVIPIVAFDMKVESLSAQTGVFLSAFASFILGLILFFIYRKDLKAEFIRFKNKFSSNLDIGLKYWVIGLCAMMVSNYIIGVVFSNGQAGNEETVQGMIGALPWMMLISAGLFAPWCEEIVFRKTLKDIFKNKWIYVFISGLFFGLAHVIGNTQVWTEWLFIIPYGSLGAAFAASYYDTDTIFTPMSFHIIHNVVLVLLSII